MSVKEKVIGIVMNRPAKPDPQDVPLGIQQLVASGVPFVISPNPDLIYEGIEPTPVTTVTQVQEMAKKLLAANPAYVKTIEPGEIAKVFSVPMTDWDSLEPVPVATDQKVTYIKPEGMVQRLVDSGTWEYDPIDTTDFDTPDDFPPASEFSTYIAPPEPRTAFLLTPAQIIALDAITLGSSVQVASKLAELQAEITFIKTKLGLDS